MSQAQPLKIVWQPQPGSQELFLSCPVHECLYEGTRGPGKTDALLMDFAQHCGKGYGPAWRGVLFRETFPQLADVTVKSKKWFYQIFPGIEKNEHNGIVTRWIWPTGEELLFRYINNPDDYWNYHGWEIPWLGWEELTNWPTRDCYEAMKSCNRSSNPDVPRKIRGTANPWGKGHNWVKAYFVDPAPPGKIIVNDSGMQRVRIHGHICENKILLAADPTYLQTLDSITDENKKKAWKEGDWDVTAGGALDDLWDRRVHVLQPFKIPGSWTVDRSFDWGSSKPFAVAWWVESDGTPVIMADGAQRTFPAGTLFLFHELYGWNGNPNEGCKKLNAEIAREIVRHEDGLKLQGIRRVAPGPADSSIFDVIDGKRMVDEFIRCGVNWTESDKSPGSRVAGLQKLRERLSAALKQPMEEPGLFAFDTCTNFIRTVPVLQRDKKKPDDVDSSAEDHIYDATRYRLFARRYVSSGQKNWK